MASVVVERSGASAAMQDALATLRMIVFRAWPYLYEGDRAYEAGYLKAFLSSDQAALVIARDGDRPVGMATASPLRDQPEYMTAPLVAAGIDIDRAFYFGESVLLPEYQGQGIGHRFFDEREAATREAGADTAIFCAVIRPDDHPARPAEARDLTPFWRARGYAPMDGVRCAMDWQDIDQPAETPHPMQFWMKRL